MNKKFVLYYKGSREEYVVLQVTDKFTKEMAFDFLDLYNWTEDFTKVEDPIIEAIYRIAAQCLQYAKTKILFQLEQVKAEMRPFFRVDGSNGVELTLINCTEIFFEPDEFLEPHELEKEQVE